jgi:hypothetical protein
MMKRAGRYHRCLDLTLGNGPVFPQQTNLLVAAGQREAVLLLETDCPGRVGPDADLTSSVQPGKGIHMSLRDAA